MSSRRRSIAARGTPSAARSPICSAPPRSTRACSAWSARWRSSGSGFDTRCARRRLPDAAQPVEPVGADASVAVMATGMVLVIVTRHIDLSVGSILGLVGMIMGVTQAEFLPRYLGFDHPCIWIIALAVGLALGAAHRRCCKAHRRLSRRAGLHRDARAACWSGAAAPGGSPRGAPWRRWTTTFQLHGRRHRGLDRRRLELGRWPRRLSLAIVWRTLHARRRRRQLRLSAAAGLGGGVRRAASPAPCVLAVVAGRQRLSTCRRASPSAIAAERGLARAAKGLFDRARPRHAGADRASASASS